MPRQLKPGEIDWAAIRRRMPRSVATPPVNPYDSEDDSISEVEYFHDAYDVRPVDPYDLFQVPQQYRKPYQSIAAPSGGRYHAYSPSSSSDEDYYGGYDPDTRQGQQMYAAMGGGRASRSDVRSQMTGMPAHIHHVDDTDDESAASFDYEHDEDLIDDNEQASFDSEAMADVSDADDIFEKFLQKKGITAGHDGVLFIEKIYRVWKHRDIELDPDDLTDRLEDAYQNVELPVSECNDVIDHIIEMLVADDNRDAVLDLAAKYDDRERFEKHDDEGAGDEITQDRVDIVVHAGATEVLEYMLERRYQEIIAWVESDIEAYDQADSLDALYEWLEGSPEEFYKDNANYAEGYFDGELDRLGQTEADDMFAAIHHNRPRLLQYYHETRQVQLTAAHTAQLPVELNHAIAQNQMVLVTYLQQQMGVAPTPATQANLKTIFHDLIKAGQIDMVRYVKQQQWVVVVSAHYRSAIRLDSDPMMALLQVPVTLPLTKVIMQGMHLNALQYFIQQDGANTYRRLKVIQFPNNVEAYRLLIILWNRSHDPSYKRDILKYALDKYRQHVPRFFAAIRLDDIYTLVKSGNVKSLRDRIIAYIAQLTDASMLILTADPRNNAGISLFLLPFPSDAVQPACDDIMSIRRLIARDRSLTTPARYVACLIGVNLNNATHYFDYVMRNAAYRMPRQDSETYSRAADGATTRRYRKQSALALKGQSVAARVDADANAKKNMGWLTGSGQRMNQKEMFEAMGRAASPSSKGGGRKSGSKPKKAITVDDLAPGDGYLYRSNLVYRRRICDMIATNYHSRYGVLKVGYYKGYPNVMVYVKVPDMRKRLGIKANLDATYAAWTDLMISFYVAIVNQIAINQGFEIELVRRSSFCHNSPTIAPTGCSFRINVGIIPTDYADIPIQALTLLEDAIYYLYTARLDRDFRFLLTSGTIYDDAEYRKYFGSVIHKPRTVFEALWMPFEKPPGKRLVYCLMRTTLCREYLTAALFNHIHIDPPEDAPSLAFYMMHAVKDCLSRGFVITKERITQRVQTPKGERRVSAIKRSLGFKDDMPIEFQKILREPIDIKDGLFFIWVQEYAQTINRRLPSVSNIPQELIDIKNRVVASLIKSANDYSMTGIYALLQTLNEIIDAWSIYYANAFGITPRPASDSEDEYALPEYPSLTLKVNKFIYHNGMRSIWLALDTASTFLYDQFKRQKKPKLFSYYAYYEKDTNWVTWRQKATVEVTKLQKGADIIFTDLNACITDGKKPAQFEPQDVKTAKVLILDVTSELSEALGPWCRKILDKSSVQVIITVCSGLKGCQGGSDRNHYGKVGVITKHKDDLDAIAGHLDTVGRPIKSVFSHASRWLMRSCGIAPRMAHIFGQAKQQRKRKLAPTPRRAMPVISYQAELPGEQLIFHAGDPERDGSCGFNAMAVSRDQLVQTVRPCVYNPAHRMALGDAVMNFLVSNPDGLGQDDYLYDLIMGYLTYNDEYMRNLIREYCRQPAKILRYLDYLSRPPAWLDYETALVYARVTHLNLYIWAPIHEGSTQLVLRDAHEENPSPPGTPTVHLLHSDSATHFQLLFSPTVEEIATYKIEAAF